MCQEKAKEDKSGLPSPVGKKTAHPGLCLPVNDGVRWNGLGAWAGQEIARPCT